MDFEKYKDIQLSALREADKFLSNVSKKERELWVVREFLKTLGLDYAEGELDSPSEDPPDVTFGTAHFEVTELMDEGRTRHKEFKERLKRLEAAQSYADILEHEDWDKEVPSPEQLIAKVEKRLGDKIYGADIMVQTDVILYVNPLKHYIDNSRLVISVPEDSPLRQWRSVTLLFNGGVAYVLFASASAPAFIREVSGRVIKR
jgi:hypothetical protein